MGSSPPLENPTSSSATRASPPLSVAGVDPECNFAGGETQVLGLALDLVAAAALRRWLRDGRYDVVHFHTSRAHAMGPWVRGLARAAVVTRRMDYVPNRLFARWLYGGAVDGVAAISGAVAGALERAGVPRER